MDSSGNQVQSEKIRILSEVFSPTAPIQDRSLFFGRIEQLSKVHQAILERGQHAILYGDRGVGKTSLANIASAIFSDVIVSKVTCNRTEDFRTLWLKALSKITFVRSSSGIGFRANTNLEETQLDLFVDNRTVVNATDIESVLSKLDDRLFIIFDEFDSVRNKDTKIRMADTIKTLSDNIPNVTILIVGIAESVTELIGNHPSVERCLLQIKMPRMSREELEEIIVNGMTRLELSIDSPMVQRIIDYSSGFPSFTHLLCKYAAHKAILDNASEITYAHFTSAVYHSLENANQSLRDAYKLAIDSEKELSEFGDLLYACALAKSDDVNYFTIGDALDEFNRLTKSTWSLDQIKEKLNQLADEERGEALEKVESAFKTKYRFRNPMMKPFVRLKFHRRNTR